MVLGESLALRFSPHSELCLVAVDIMKCIWRESQDILNFNGQENSSGLLQQEENTGQTQTSLSCADQGSTELLERNRDK